MRLGLAAKALELKNFARQTGNANAMKLGRFLIIVGLMAASMSAYQSDPAPNSPQSVRIVKVRTGSSCGWCTNPSEQETVVERNSISLIRGSLSDRKAPDFKMQYKITKRDWNDLTHFIDATVLSAFDVPAGCPGCADESTGLAEIQFSDGTKKFTAYNTGDEPAAILELLKKIGALQGQAFLAHK
jgi:hypothetical protein